MVTTILRSVRRIEKFAYLTTDDVVEPWSSIFLATDPISQKNPKMRKSSYFTYAKLNPTENDQYNVDKFCKNTASYSLYSIDEIRDDLTLMEGCIVFSKKVSVFEAANILTGFTVTPTDNFSEKSDEIMQQEIVRIVNHHPAVSVKINLMEHFLPAESEVRIATRTEDETVTTVQDDEW